MTMGGVVMGLFVWQGWRLGWRLEVQSHNQSQSINQSHGFHLDTPHLPPRHTPFSVWVGQWELRKEIRDYGDKTRATNVFQVGGFAWFGLALALDVSKRPFPWGWPIKFFGWQGWEILPIALAIPSAAFSPFCGGAVARQWQRCWGRGWANAVGRAAAGHPVLALLALLLAPRLGSAAHPLAVALFASWLQQPICWLSPSAHAALLAWTHGDELRQRPGLRRKKNEIGD
ncbi:MAG: glycerol-3-phosphate acyltransferase [Ardenticatenaceae bacterium]|nr:glycerol-3-phosphate acyltransferase [Ardenticatenaceae bacterium]